jgi:membrane-associated phospholipid phosphatase
VLNALLTQGIKVAVHRTRPDEGRFSFPSGHASSTFATATVLQREFGWRVGLPAYGLAAYVAESRIQENRHYASDVIFGAAVGIVSGRTVGIQRGARRFELSPAVVPGGAAVVFTRTR